MKFYAEVDIKNIERTETKSEDVANELEEHINEFEADGWEVTSTTVSTGNIKKEKEHDAAHITTTFMRRIRQIRNGGRLDLEMPNGCSFEDYPLAGIIYMLEEVAKGHHSAPGKLDDAQLAAIGLERN